MSSPSSPSGAPDKQLRDEQLRAERVVAAAYRTILLREPDPGGLSAWRDELLGGRITLEGLLTSLLRSDEFANRSSEFLARYVRAGKLAFTNDVSQNGELPLLLRNMVNQAARHRLLVDVGARGRDRSNSYDLLLHFGWKGVLIEANPNLVGEINRDFAGLDFVLENCAVSNYAGTAPFYIGANDDVSSLDRGTAAAWGGLRGRTEVRVERLETILRAHAVPLDFDLLSIDAEGQDLNILNDLVQTEYVPSWILIEASDNFAVTSLNQLAVLPAVAGRYALVGQTKSNLLLRAKVPARG